MNEMLSTATNSNLLTELHRLADAGEVAGPLAHEINNFLNVLVLNVAVLEQMLPEGLRTELQQIGRQGLAVAELIRQFQQSRRAPLGPPQAIDPHEVLHEVLATLGAPTAEPGRVPLVRLVTADTAAESAEGVPVTLDLATALPPVLAWPLDLRRLLTFLVGNAAVAAAARGGQVTVRTRHNGSRVYVRVEDTGAPVPADQLVHFFEASAPARPGVNRLEIAACRSIVRRLQGKIEAEARADLGVAVVVELKPAV